MKSSLYSLILLLTLWQAEAQESRSIIVDGEASDYYIPDVTKLTLRFSEKAENQEKALSNLDKALNETVKVLTENSFLAKEDLLTSYFESNKRIDYKTNEEHVDASQTLTTKFKTDKEKILTILNILKDFNIEASYKLDLKFSEQRTNEIEKELTRRAFDNARSKADLLATSGKFKLKEIAKVNFSQRFINRDVFAAEAIEEKIDIGYGSSRFGGFNVEPSEVSRKITVEYYIE